jgi:hypothetical protein
MDSLLLGIGCEAFRGSLVIPASVRRIEEHAFSRCRALSSVTFPPDSRLWRIEGGAFHETPLRKVVLPPGAEEISPRAFPDGVKVIKSRIGSYSGLPGFRS